VAVDAGQALEGLVGGALEQGQTGGAAGEHEEAGVAEGQGDVAERGEAGDPLAVGEDDAGATAEVVARGGAARPGPARR
jgi:hypothetical protein